MRPNSLTTKLRAGAAVAVAYLLGWVLVALPGVVLVILFTAGCTVDVCMSRGPDMPPVCRSDVK